MYVHGRIQLRDQMPRSQTYLSNHKTRTGSYRTVAGATAGTTLTLWVPVPTGPTTPAGIFLRLSNKAGSAYSRLSPIELQQLTLFIQEHTPELQSSYFKAQTIHSELERSYKEAISFLSEEEIDISNESS